MIDYQIRVYKKEKKWIYVIFAICAIILILLSAYIGIKLAQKKYDKDVEEKTEQIYEFLTNIEEKTNDEKDAQIDKNEHKYPVMTEESINNMKNIFTSEYKRVFLTFDDGPSGNITPLILDVLKENNIKATFFTLGSRVIQNPDLVKREYEEGHYVANHGYTHVYSNMYQSKNTFLDEYYKTEDVIRQAIGLSDYSTHLFRFPGGSSGGKYDKVKKQYKTALRENGALYIDWNCLNEDATGNRTKEQLVQFVKDTSANKNSVIVLMHDAGDKILTYETLQEVIDYFKDEGYVFENFYDIMGYETK